MPLFSLRSTLLGRRIPVELEYEPSAQEAQKLAPAAADDGALSPLSPVCPGLNRERRIYDVALGVRVYAHSRTDVCECARAGHAAGVCVCMCVCVRARLRARVRVCVSVRACACACVRARVCAFICVLFASVFWCVFVCLCVRQI